MKQKIDLSRNSSPATINGVTLHRGGKPLQAGDIEPGQIIDFNPFTGEVRTIEDDPHPKR